MKKTKNKVEKFIRRNEALLSIDPAFCFKSLQHAPQMSSLLIKVQRAMQHGILPIRLAAREAYLLKGIDHEPLAIFKPFKEVGYQDALRECLAYRLDHKGFAKVPATVMTTLQHPILGGQRRGSCQSIVHPAETLYRFQTSHVITEEQIRRLAILDIRLMNLDRHVHNVLVKERQLYPIDHGEILPRKEVNAHFFWSDHPHAMTEATQEEVEYLKNIDVRSDVKMLIEEFELPQCLARRYAVAHFLLQEGIAQGYKIAKIGECLVRRTCKTRSLFSLILQGLSSSMDNSWEEFVCDTERYIRNFYKGDCTCV